VPPVIYMHAKFEFSSFNRSRDMYLRRHKISNVGHVTLSRPTLT